MKPRDLTFAEREGQKPLPSQLSLGEVSQETRARVWAVIHDHFEKHNFLDRQARRMRNRPWHAIVRKASVEFDFAYVDKVSPEPRVILDYCRNKISKEYGEFFEFIELACNELGQEFSDRVNIAMRQSGSAYRFIDRQIMPISSPESAEQFEISYQNVANFSEASAEHLRNAAKCLTRGDYKGSIRESIHAVESVAVQIAPNSETLGESLNKLNKYQKIHPAMKDGFSKLYGFTNDEGGIRHALIDDRPETVGESEAMYMLGACASFADYLARKLRMTD